MPMPQVCVPCEPEKPEEGAAEATKDAKKLGGRRNRRGARPWGANAALYAKARLKKNGDASIQKDILNT